MRTALLRTMRSLHAGVVLFLIAWFLVQFCFAGVYAVLMNLYVLRLGYGPRFVGVVQGTMALGYAAFALVGGGIGSRLGCRRAITIGLACNVLFSGLIPLSVFLDGAVQRALLILPYGLYGMCLTLVVVNGVAYLANASEPSSRTAVFAIFQAIAPVAGFCGSLVAGFLPGAIARAGALPAGGARSYAFSLWIVTLLYGLTLLIFLRAQETERQECAAAQRRPRVPLVAILVVLGVSFLRSALAFGLGMFFNAYVRTALVVSTPVIGGLMSVARLAGAPAALATPVLIARIGKRRVVIAAGIMSVVLTAPAILLGGLAPAAFSLIAVLAASSVCITAYTPFHQGITHPLWRSIMSGAVATADGLSYAAVGYVGGIIIDVAGYQRLFLLVALATLGGVALFWRFFTPARERALTTAAEA